MSNILAEFNAHFNDCTPEQRKLNAGELWDRLQAEAELVTEPAEWDRNGEHSAYTTFTAIVSDELFFKIALDSRFTAKPVKVTKPGTKNIAQQVAEKQQQVPPAELAYNPKVEVHVPGFALTTYNRVMLLEDSCTDALQTALNQGWRIIAACPQPDSRRPDYVLGRYEQGLTEKLDDNTPYGYAARGYDLPRHESKDVPKVKPPTESDERVQQAISLAAESVSAASGLPTSLLTSLSVDDEIPF